MTSTRHDVGRVDAVEAIENFNMGEFTQPKKSIRAESISQPNRGRFEVPGIVYGLRSRARYVTDWIKGEFQNASFDV